MFDHLSIASYEGELTGIDDGGDPGDYPDPAAVGSDSEAGRDIDVNEEEESDEEEADLVVLDPDHVSTMVIIRS